MSDRRPLDERPVDQQLAFSQAHLDLKWEEFRHLVQERLSQESIVALWQLTSRATPPTSITPEEWLVLAFSTQLAVKQVCTNTVRRAMEDPHL